ncbi:MAG: competence/damage-inducible protein A [Butyrivibrio sp.]|nr:competence/damage-inducible protein A [Acetatifactor muris]MCM1560403.1 competence/damage-inducible protein A [Butyrivibrio sp.]
MTVELICVGTELLLGNIVNTNAAYLAEKCAELGLACYFQTVVGDNRERLSLVLRTALERSDVVILSGGLGPTEDDLTKEVAAEVCGKQLVMHNPSKKAIKKYFEQRGVRPTDNNWKQAMLPEGCIVLENHNGTAPGAVMELENAKVVLLPGPPNELCPMFEESVMPYLAGLTAHVICSQTVKICGIGESRAETMVKDLIDAQTNPTIATYAKTGEVHIRVTAGAEDQKAAMKLIKPVVKELKSRFGNDIYSTEEDTTLEKAVVDLLRANGLTVTCAESCTGGLLSARLINVPGASDIYKSGVITYSNKAKRRFLGVKKSTLQKHGAVSQQTAEEMAKGAALLLKADAAVAVTGLAGPDGGTEEKPVGLVYIACSVKGQLTVKKYQFSGSRSKIRDSAVSAALALLRGCILEYFSKVIFGKKD